MNNEHKALVIIDQKNVNVRFLKVSSSLENYNLFVSKMANGKENELTLEEYEFLKEVFNNLR